MVKQLILTPTIFLRFRIWQSGRGRSFVQMTSLLGQQISQEILSGERVSPGSEFLPGARSPRSEVHQGRWVSEKPRREGRATPKTAARVPLNPNRGAQGHSLPELPPNPSRPPFGAEPSSTSSLQRSLPPDLTAGPRSSYLLQTLLPPTDLTATSSLSCCF